MVCRLLDCVSFSHGKQEVAELLRPLIVDRHNIARVQYAVESAKQAQSTLSVFNFDSVVSDTEQEEQR